MPEEGIHYDPYELPVVKTKILGIIKDGEIQEIAKKGEEVEVILAETGFYIESGGQVSDVGTIVSEKGAGKLKVRDVRKPAAGVIVHSGTVIDDVLEKNEAVTAAVDLRRRQDIMRNHTATHLLHAELKKVLGDHVRQAGSLVAPDRLRFDFTHPVAMSKEEIKQVEEGVNRVILDNFKLNIEYKELSDALKEGAVALFGEKYGEVVRTITIGDKEPFSYELCGGTHVGETAEIGSFVILNEGSVAAGIRRIEAVTGRRAYEVLFQRSESLKTISEILESPMDSVVSALKKLKENNEKNEKELQQLKWFFAKDKYEQAKKNIRDIDGVILINLALHDSNIDILRKLTDIFKQEYDSGIAVFANIHDSGSVQIITAVTDKLVDQGYHAGNIAKNIAEALGGSGGGRPQLAQAGAKNGEKIEDLMKDLPRFIK